MAKKKARRPGQFTSRKKKTAKKKVANKKKSAKKAAKKRSGKLSMGKSNVDPDQKSLPGMEENRVPSIEAAIKKIVEKKSQRSRLKEEVDELVCKIPGLFKKHKLNSYSCLGKTVSVEHGSDIVKIKKAKEQ